MADLASIPSRRTPLAGRADALWVAALVLVPLAYFWLIRHYGWSDTDDGFVLGSAWRVVGGEAPYRDFIDVRPPTSAYLHSLWLALVDPRYAYAAARFAAIAEMWVSSLVASWALATAGGRAATRPTVFALALAGFLLSATAFTPMPWHTVDGVFFCALGAGLLIARRGARPAALAGLFIVLGMGAKQSFYPVAPLAVGYLLVQARRKDAAVLAGAMVLALAAFATWLASQGAFSAFVLETSARTGPGFIAEDLAVYRDQGLPAATLLIGVVAAAWLAGRLLKRPLGRGVAAALVGLAIVGLYLARLHDEGGWVNASTLGYPHGLFLIAAAVAAWRAAHKDQRDQGLAALLMLAIAWCASLSIGFPTPLLFAAPLVAIPFLALDPTRTDDGARAFPAWVAAAFACAMVGLTALYPYEDRDARLDDSCPLSRVEPRLALIVSGPKTCAKLAEYERLRRVFAGAFVTLPAFDTAYLLAGVRDPIAADWPTLAETAGASPRLIDEADARVRYAFVEDAEAEAFSVGDQAMPLLDHIRRTWPLASKGSVYSVYRNPRD